MDKVKYIAFLIEKYNLHPKIAELLYMRGIDTVEDAEAFFDCSAERLSSPYIFPQMDDCVHRLKKAVASKEKILIFGDYDCDGIGATVILAKSLKTLGADVSTFIPLRKTDGYGIKWESLKRAYETFRPSLIVSVDCGISSYKEISRAREEFGVEFIITDHHSLPEVLPDTIVINPHLVDGSELCGAGVAFMVSVALLGVETALNFVDICALSTVADLVPLVGDNRIIVSLGLAKINARKVGVGLRALIDVCGIKPGDEINTYDLAFKLIPRLNSAGRLESAESSLKLLLTDDVFEATVIAAELDNRNKERQALCETVYLEALETLKTYDIAGKGHILLENDGWDSGVLGIAASKLVEAFGVPTILLTKKNGLYTGSGRSVVGVNMFEMLSKGASFTSGFGGHAMAAGLQFKPENFDKLSQIYTDFVSDNPPDERNEKCELEMNAEEIDVPFAKSLKKLEPFGMGNKNPTVEIVGDIEFTRIKEYNHIKAKLGKEAELVAFSQGKNIDFFNSFGRSYAVRTELEVFRNVEKAKCYFEACIDAEFNVDDEWLTMQFLSAYLKKYSEKAGIKRKKIKSCGNLVITYSPTNYAKFLAENEDYRGYVSIKNDMSVNNAIVLAPTNSMRYSYWSSVSFLDAIPAPLAEFIRISTAASVEYNKNEYKEFLPKNVSFSDCEFVKHEICRKLNGKKFTSFKEIFSNYIYNLYNSEGKEITYVTYLVAFLAMIESRVAGFDREGRIVIIDENASIRDSLIMKEVSDAR